MASTLFTVTSPNESSRTMMPSGTAKNVTRGPFFPVFCTGSESSPGRLRYRMMTMASIPHTNTNTGNASQRMMNQSLCTSCAFGSSPVFTRPQPVVTSGSASRSARRSARRWPPGTARGPWFPGREPSGTGSRPLSSGVIRCDIITSSGGSERCDHADRDVRRAGAAAGLAGLPAGRHVVPGREVHGDRGAEVGGQRVPAVGVVDPVVLGLGPLLLRVVDHVLGGLAVGQPEHHELVVDLERLLVGERDHDRPVGRHRRRHAVVGEVLDGNEVSGHAGGGRRRRRRRRRAAGGSPTVALALGAAGRDEEDGAGRNGHKRNRMQERTNAPSVWTGPAWQSHGCSFAPSISPHQRARPPVVPWCRA